ncbi:TPA: tail assembly protein [Serratia marcescens]|nr:tail assembly protein [Serratia marcescens]
MATHDSLNLALPRVATFCLYGDLQRFGRRFAMNVESAAEGLHGLLMQIPPLRQRIREGWYQVRISGCDVLPNDFHQRLHEPLAPGAVVHIVPRLAGAAKGGAFQFIAGAAILAVGWWNPAGWGAAATIMMSTGAAMMLGGVAQMLTPMPKSPTLSRSEEEKGNTYFSNLDNAVAQGMPVPVVYGEMLCGSRVISQAVEIMDDGDAKQIDAGKHGG